LPRLLSTLLVLGLLGGTAAAFAVTERLKLVPSPIVAPKVTKAFSPVCRCPTDHAEVSFRLRKGDRVTVSIIDARNEVVDTLYEGERRPAGPFSFSWDGHGLAEGPYRVRVHLANARRTIDVPNELRLDTTPPELSVESVRPTRFSPDGDGKADKVSARFSVSEPSRVRLLVNGERRVETPPRKRGKIDWYGKRLEPGTYVLTLLAQDLAGNVSPPSAATRVRLRFVELAPRRIDVPAGLRFGVRVSTDAERYRWRLGARNATSGLQTLVLRAPQRPGRYTLAVSYAGHRDAIPVFVRARP